MPSRFYITTPIYYVNSHPHIGHAYTTLVTDVLTRFHKLFGEDTHFLTGTDEHGQKIEESATQAGISPQKFVDQISLEFKNLWDHLHVEYDQFIRTTDSEHKKYVQKILQQIYDQGEIYLKEYEGLYCVGCERFLDEGELVEGNCPDHQVPPRHHKEQNYFFKMSAYQDWLLEYIEKNPDWIHPERYRNEVIQFLSHPLQDLCISRPKSRLTWGIELPFDSEFVTYVWFDALLNYVSALHAPESDLFETYWEHAHHVIGKDILKTHAIYWPCMLKAAQIPVFQKLVVHGHWVSSGSKMSKSLGNVIDPLAMKDKVGVDALRYFLLRDMSFGDDANFTEEQVITRYNGDLANNIGNLLHRSLNMSRKNFGGCTPPKGNLGDLEEELATHFIKGVEQIQTYILNFQTHRALEHVAFLSSHVNKYIDICAPWKLAKASESRERLGTVLYTALDMSRILVQLLTPVMPAKMKSAREFLGISDIPLTMTQLAPWLLPEERELPVPAPLFPKMKVVLPEVVELPAPKAKSKKTSAQKVAPVNKATIAIETFDEIELKTGRIQSCEAVPKSKKLLCSQVDVGEEGLRSIVSGIAECYTPESLIGKSVLVVSNLKAVKLRGVLSEGMLLCAEQEGELVLIETPEGLPTGSIIR